MAIRNVKGKSKTEKEVKQRMEVKTRSKKGMLKQMEQINREIKGDVALRERQASAFMFMNTCIEIGNKVFCCIPLTMLRIDHDTYQRPLHKTCNQIIENWDDDKCDPITVNYRSDGYFYVIDGQHRTEAARKLGIDFLVCNVFVGLSIVQEAEIFAGQFDGKTKLSPIDSFKANIVRGEKVDILLKEVCDSYGVLIKKGKAPMVLGSLTVARRIVKQDRAILEWVFDVLLESNWGIYNDTFNADMLQSLSWIYTRNKDYLVNAKDKLVTFFSDITPKELRAIGNMKYPMYGHGTGMFYVMTNIVDGMSKKKLLPAPTV